MRVRRSAIAGGLLVFALLFVAPAARAEDDGGEGAPKKEMTDDELFARVKVLEDEGTEYFKTSSDTELSMKKRNDARKEAYTRLKEAYDLLAKYVDEHEDKAEKLEDRMVNLHYMIYWIRKESPNGLLEPENPPEERHRLEDWPDKPPDDLDEPALGPEDTGSEPTKPTRPARVELTPRDLLDRAKAYERKYPTDVAGCLEIYESFVERHADADPDVLNEALERIAALNARLKAAYRKLRDDDPDALENVDGSRAVRLVKEYEAKLAHGSVEERVAAATALGYLGSGRAARRLVKTLEREREGPLFDAAADALARIGGRRVCDELASLAEEAPLAGPLVGILSTIVHRGGVEARVAGDVLGTIAENLPEDLREVALARLAEAGRPASGGLAHALLTVPSPKALDYIEQIGEKGEPRAAEHLASFLVVNAPGLRRRYARAAREAIEKLGVAAVPYLIPHLDDEKVAVWTAEMLHRLTGADLRNDKRRTWEKWYRRNRRRLEDPDR